MSNASLKRYRQYLAENRIAKRLDALGVKITTATINSTSHTFGSGYWRKYVDSDLNAGKVPNLYRFADIQLYIENFVDYEISDREEREKVAQEKREQLIRDFVAKYPDTLVARFSDGNSYLFIDSEHAGEEVTVNIGQALCERVLVREDVTEVPDPVLAEKALENVPLVKKVVPVYEWRCNDAEFAGSDK